VTYDGDKLAFSSPQVDQVQFQSVSRELHLGK
jgi:hypothetical protein